MVLIVMSEENNAALVDPLDAFVQEAIDQDSNETTEEATTTESAPVEDAKEPDSTEAEKPKEDGFQKRINKVTADKHDAKRKEDLATKRADDLQAQLDKLNESATLTEPKLEEHNYDEDAFNKATVSFNVQEQVKAELTKQAAAQKQVNQDAEAQKLTESFNDQISALGKEDFTAKAESLPTLPPGVAGALMSLENGAEIIYHLGNHLDKADSLAGMSPMAAMAEIGRISSQMSTKPEIKLSAAPDPIEPVTAGSSLSSNMDDEMSIDAWMSKYN